MIFKGKVNYSASLSGVLQKYNPKLNFREYHNKILYLEKSINSILDYLPFVKGIILKEGSILSHVAIVSREFKIPSIIGVDLTNYFSNTAHVKINNNKVIFTCDNYLNPTKNFVKLIKKAKNYYLIHANTKKISLNQRSFQLIKDLQKKTIKEIKKKYGEKSIELINSLVKDQIFYFSTNKKSVHLFESNRETPDILDLQITTKCNMACKFCYANIDQNKGVNLDYKQIKKILDFAKKSGICFVSITGGEPTLHPQFSQIVNYIKAKGFILHLNTNGTVINKKILDTLKNTNDFGISFDSVDARDFEFLRGKNKTNRVMTNIKKVLATGLSPTIVVVVNTININSLFILVNRLKKIGIKKIKLNYLLPIGRGKSAKKLTVSYQEYIKAYKKLCSTYPSMTLLFDSLMFSFRFGQAMKKEKDTISCSAFDKRISIDALGNVNGCLLLPKDYVIGNIYVDDINNLFLKKSSFQKTDLKNKYCDTCNYKKYCGFGCMAFYVKGKGVKDPRCPKVEKYEYQ